MKITIYQIIPELDQDRLMFMPLSYFQKSRVSITACRNL